MQKRSPAPYVLRSLLSGALGGLLILVIGILYEIQRLGHVPYLSLVVFAGVPLFLLGGAAIGGVVGLLIWGIGLIFKRELGAVWRAIAGFVCAEIVIGSIWLLRTQDNGLTYEPASWTWQVFNWVIFGIILGALPGLMARPRVRGLHS